MTTPASPSTPATMVSQRAAAADTRGSVRAFLRRHWLILVLVTAGTVLRVLVQVAYQPAILYIGSLRYLADTSVLDPTTFRPSGYEILLLRWLLPLHDLAIIPLVQHLLGLAMGVAIYAALSHRGVRTWLAALAAAPVLLDGYQLQIEQLVSSDTLFQAMLVFALLVLLWRRWPPYSALAGAGFLLGLAVTVRLVGVLLFVPALVYVLLFTLGWRRRVVGAGILTLYFALPLFAYAAWYNHVEGDFRITSSETVSKVVYARTADIANCAGLARAGVSPEVQSVCPAAPIYERWGPDAFAHSPRSPIKQAEFASPRAREDAMRGLAWSVAKEQPLELAGVVARDFVRGFLPVRTELDQATPLDRWRFTTDYPDYPKVSETKIVERFGGSEPSGVPAIGSFLRGYQSVVYTSGAVFALGLLTALLAAFGAGKARGSQLRGAGLLVAGTGTILLLVAAGFEFSWRFQLPSVALYPWAAALGLTALFVGRPLPRRPYLLGDNDPIDEGAIADFSKRYPNLRFGPIVVVIAAYNESVSIGRVIDAVPPQACGLAVDTLVVNDGSLDETGDVAVSHGAYTANLALNRGQGAALRLGYRIARECGARFIVTTDADGQYDTDELPVILQPLLDDEADFVTGSRRMGREDRSDPVRWLGVRVFAKIVSLLSGHRITDTSNGFRAMRADVTEAVTLCQPQYQAGELLMGVLAHGFRVVERPTTMRTRIAGTTKKGGNLVYGYRYGTVIAGTWFRERFRPSRVPVPPQYDGANSEEFTRGDLDGWRRRNGRRARTSRETTRRR